MAGLEQVALSSPHIYNASILAITISVLIAGIALGAGVAMQSRKLRRFGMEELSQSILNAAILGSLAAIVIVIDSLAASVAHPASECGLPGALGAAQCNFQLLQSELFSIASGSSQAAYIAGFLSSITLDLGSLELSQFSGLSQSVVALGEISAHSYSLSSAAWANVLLLSFASDAAMAAFLPLGLLLRSFFITRRIGGAIMALAISAYVFYPLSTLVGFSPALWSSLSGANAAMADFSSRYSSIPATDLSTPNSLSSLVSDLSKGDVAGDISALQRASSQALAAGAAGSIIYPLIALLVSAIAFLELSRFLGGELALGLFERA